MKYFETIHEKNSARITALIVVILVLLIFVMGPKYIDPPLEYGVAVNFGTTDFGNGKIQPTEPLKSNPKQIVEETQTNETKQEPTEADSNAEDVLTNESPEAIAIRKQKEAEEKAKAEEDRIERERIEAEEKKLREEEEKKKALDALIGGVSNSEGPQSNGEGSDDQPGDKGDLDGDPYAPSYFGGSGPGKGDVGYGLGGRGKISNKVFSQDCNEEGLVVVEIRVNKSGKVIKAEPGIRGTTGTSCLFEAARKTAMSFKFTPNQNAPDLQVGYVSINFTLGQ